MEIFIALFPYVGIIWAAALVAALIIQKLVPDRLHGFVRTIIFFVVAAVVAAIAHGIASQFLPLQMAALDLLLSGAAVYYVAFGFAGSVLAMGLVFELSDSGYAHVTGMLVSFVFFMFFGYVLNDQYGTGYQTGYQEGIYAGSEVPTGRTTLPILIETDSGALETVVYPKTGEYQQFYDLVTGVERAGGKVTLRRGKPSGGGKVVIFLILAGAAVAIFFLLVKVRKPKEEEPPKTKTILEQRRDLEDKVHALEAKAKTEEGLSKSEAQQLAQLRLELQQVGGTTPQAPPQTQSAQPNPGAQPVDKQLILGLPSQVAQLTALAQQNPEQAKVQAQKLLNQLQEEIPKMGTLSEQDKVTIQEQVPRIQALIQGGSVQQEPPSKSFFHKVRDWRKK